MGKSELTSMSIPCRQARQPFLHIGLAAHQDHLGKVGPGLPRPHPRNVRSVTVAQPAAALELRCASTAARMHWASPTACTIDSTGLVSSKARLSGRKLKTELVVTR